MGWGWGKQRKILRKVNYKHKFIDIFFILKQKSDKTIDKNGYVCYNGGSL